MLINGVWERKWDPVQKQDAEGRFIRQNSAFSGRIKDVEKVKNKHIVLYVAYLCPWATRTLIARSLLGLEEYIDIHVVEPTLTDYGWMFGDFSGSTSSGIDGVNYMHQLYTMTDAKYTGRATVPVLWDKENSTIINNESSDILTVFNDDLRPVHQSSINLYPKTLRPEINAFNDSIYNSLNNGVYRAGFATSQLAYEEAITDIFTTLEKLENHFLVRQYAVGEQLTESDIKLFVTLSRFDVAYFSLFKTNMKAIAHYPALSKYMERLLEIEAFSKNTRIDHIKAGYYSIEALNPSGIIPKGPDLSWFSYLKAGI